MEDDDDFIENEPKINFLSLFRDNADVSLAKTTSLSLLKPKAMKKRKKLPDVCELIDAETFYRELEKKIDGTISFSYNNRSEKKIQETQNIFSESSRRYWNLSHQCDWANKRTQDEETYLLRNFIIKRSSLRRGLTWNVYFQFFVAPIPSRFAIPEPLDPASRMCIWILSMKSRTRKKVFFLFLVFFK